MRDQIKSVYFRLSPVRRSTDRIESALALNGEREKAIEDRVAALEAQLHAARDRLRLLDELLTLPENSGGGVHKQDRAGLYPNAAGAI